MTQMYEDVTIKHWNNLFSQDEGNRGWDTEWSATIASWCLSRRRNKPHLYPACERLVGMLVMRYKCEDHFQPTYEEWRQTNEPAMRAALYSYAFFMVDMGKRWADEIADEALRIIQREYEPDQPYRDIDEDEPPTPTEVVEVNWQGEGF